MTGTAQPVGTGDSASDAGKPTSTFKPANRNAYEASFDSLPEGDSSESTSTVTQRPVEQEVSLEKVAKELEAELDAEQPDAEQDEESAAERKLKLKVNGKEYDVAEKDVVAAAQQWYASQDLLKQAKTTKAEAARQRSQINELLSIFRDADHETIADQFKRLGRDFTALARDHAYHAYQLENMSDAERQAYQERQELLRHKRELERYKQMEAEQSRAKQDAMYDQLLAQSLPNVLEQAGLPTTPHVYRRFATLYESLLPQLGGEPKNAAQFQQQLAQVIPMLVAEYKADMDAERVAVSKQQRVQQVQQKPKPKATPESIGRKPVGKRDAYISDREFFGRP